MKCILVVLSLFSINAFAYDPSFPYVQSVRSNGSIAPKHRRTTTCTVEGSTMRKITMGPDIRALPIYKKTQWTKAVPNEKTMEKLLKEASKGQIVNAKCLPPPGSSMTRYSGVYKTVKSNNEKTVKLGSNPCSYINTSSAAADLIDFIKTNCE